MFQIEFSNQMVTDYKTLAGWHNFENVSHLRGFLRSYAFAPIYRIRTHQNEFGRVTSKELLAVMDDGREFYLGQVIN